MKIIAFDLGATFALAHNAKPGVLTVSHIERSAGMIREHWLACIMGNLEIYFQARGKFDLAIYERPFARGQAATRALWGQAGVVEAVATRHGLPVLDMPPSTIKKFATGHGHASKQDMMAAAKQFGYKSDNEHEADAVCLLKYAEKNVEWPNVS